MVELDQPGYTRGFSRAAERKETKAPLEDDGEGEGRKRRGHKTSEVLESPNNNEAPG